VISLGSIVSSKVLIVRGDSMLPSFAVGDVVLVNRRAFEEAGPARLDVVAIRDSAGSGMLHLKRVVGLPGERVALSDGLLYIDGTQTSEPYLGGLPSSLGLSTTNWLLGEDEYVVLGDSRSHSTDSRNFGPISADQIVGKTWLRVWPANKGFGV
jgi:signal peptidase I